MTRYRLFYPIITLLKHIPLVLALLLFITCNGNAHPHLFIQTRYTLVFDDQGLSGIRVYWTLDEMYSSMTGNDFDKNGDGIFNAQESGELVKLALESLPDFDFFTHITIDGQSIPVKQVTQFDITFESGILDYQFYIPCKVNATAKKRFLKISPYDPCNYAVMLFSDDQPVLTENGNNFSIQSTIEEDKEKKIYFDMLHPITLKLVLKKKTMKLHSPTFCCISLFRKKILPTIAIFFIGMAFLCSGSFSAARANPLLGNNGSHTQAVIDKPTTHQSFFSKIVAQTTLVQMQLRHKISSHVKRFNKDKKLLPLLPLFFITFAYGALHAAGPGHGKAIAMSYALGTKHTYMTSLFLGPLIAFIHAGSAILFVLILHVILHKAISTSMTTVTHISQIVSYSLISLLGLYLLCSSVFSWFKTSPSQPDHALSQPQTKQAGLLPVAFAIGAVPCPGVIMVLLFCFSLGQIVLGVFLGLSVSLGMAVTITLAILVSFSGRNLVLLSSARWKKGLTILEQCFHTLSGVLVTTLGVVLLASAL